MILSNVIVFGKFTVHVYLKPVLKVDFTAWPRGLTFHSVVARQPVRRRDLTTILLDSKQ